MEPLFFLTGQRRFSPQNPPNLAIRKRPRSASPTSRTSPRASSPGRRARAQGAGRRSGTAPGVFKPGLEPAGPDAPAPPSSRLSSSSQLSPRAPPPSAPRSPGAQAPAGGARGAGRGRCPPLRSRPPAATAAHCPTRAARAAAARLHAPSEPRQPEPGRRPRAPRGRAGGCGSPASSPQHGFGFRRAERGRARDSRRYRGAAAAQPGGPGAGGGEAGAGNLEYFSELPGGRPIPSRPGLRLLRAVSLL